MPDNVNKMNPTPEGDDGEPDPDRIRDQLTRVTAPPELDSAVKRKKWKLEDTEDKRGPYLVELNVQHVGGLPGAAEGFLKLYGDLFGRSDASAPDDDSLLYEEAGVKP